MQRIAILSFLVCLPLLCGCFGIVPIGHHASESGPRGCSRDDAEGMIEDGKTTRSQLAEKLGTGLELARGKLWVYTFQDYGEQRFFVWRFIWWYDIHVGGSDSSLESCTDYYLLIEFDEADTVKRHRLRREGKINGLATGWDDVFQ
jgi:hypothetical protein